MSDTTRSTLPEGLIGPGSYLPVPHAVEIAWLVIQDYTRKESFSLEAMVHLSYPLAKARGFRGEISAWESLLLQVNQWIGQMVLMQEPFRPIDPEFLAQHPCVSPERDYTPQPGGNYVQPSEHAPESIPGGSDGDREVSSSPPLGRTRLGRRPGFSTRSS